jgi:hypothetical protein
MKFKFLCVTFFIFLRFSGQELYQKKKVSDAHFRYEFYVTEEKAWIEKDKIYYWFKGGLIHQAESGVGGSLLNGNFIKYYNSNQISEQGSFELGLKIGLWKQWYENGSLFVVENWKNGLLNGDYFKINNDGETIEKGAYKRGLKHGQWIFGKDTIQYKNGQKIIVDKAKFDLNKKDGDNNSSKKNNFIHRVGVFFKKLFSKKPKKDVVKSK